MTRPVDLALLDNYARRESPDSLQPQRPRERPSPARWPRLDDSAMYGLAGDYVRALDAHTEADPVAVLVQFLASFGSVIGRGAHFRAEADRHYSNLFAVIVGETAKGRKGTSAGHVRAFYAAIDPEWERARVLEGLSSGEGLIWNARDPIYKTKINRETGITEDVLEDAGIEDKRLLLIESEFAGTLKVLSREGNTLSPILRRAWDRGDLRSLTKNSPAVATGAHISIVGHIVAEELRRHLAQTEAANGFGNRFLWICAKRSKCLPEGGSWSETDAAPFVARLREAVDHARRLGDWEITRDAAARELWSRVYPELSDGRPGMLGAMTARAEAQTMRLALHYALLDRSQDIGLPHLVAGLALWRYAEDSARYIFGDGLGDPVADAILSALRQAPDGLTRTQMHAALSRHATAAEIDRALEVLLAAGRVTREPRKTGGRPAEVWRCC